MLDMVGQDATLTAPLAFEKVRAQVWTGGIRIQFVPRFHVLSE
jgi:hypothetical protein